MPCAAGSGSLFSQIPCDEILHRLLLLWHRVLELMDPQQKEARATSRSLGGGFALFSFREGSGRPETLVMVTPCDTYSAQDLCNEPIEAGHS